MTVHAGGGVVARDGRTGLEVVLVHRPRYDDWSLPKGKLKQGEADAAGALREVEEETGLRCELRHELASSHYRDAAGRPKSVRFWAMSALGGRFTPSREVDELCWLAPREALDLLTYDRDRRVLRSFGHDGNRALIVVRHAAAGHREREDGNDRPRPLTARGRRQAEALTAVLEGHVVERIVSSPFLRCSETVQPLAAATGLEVELREELAEGAGPGALRDVAAGPGTVVCVHGDLLSDLLGASQSKGSVTLLDPASLEPIATIPPPA